MSRSAKHRWTFINKYLAGIKAGDWWRLLRDNRFAVDPDYWHRAAFVTLASVFNSVAAGIENVLYRSAIERTQIVDAPVFLLGHWRSGTTFLHNVLARDAEQFATPNTFQVVCPHTFLSLERYLPWLLSGLIPNTRPMDNVELSFWTPHEDEFAPCVMSLRSPYLGILFPRRFEYYSKYVSFRDTSEREIKEWKRALLWFLKKLTFKKRRALLLKSPPHTAKIRYLLEMFPEARFIHIHRNPYAVFQSYLHYYHTAPWYTYLQRPDLSALEEMVIVRYTEVYDAFFRDLPMIPEKNYYEMKFEDLEEDPVREVRSLYEGLGLEGIDLFLPKLTRYLDSLSHYRKNVFDPLPEPSRRRIHREWRRSFDAWSYPENGPL